MSQIPSALKRNPVENPFAYSREFMLNLFDLASGLDSLPDDVDPSLLCWMEEAREPLAMMPLSDTEKKLPKEVKSDDLWDLPAAPGVGATHGFSSDGVFGSIVNKEQEQGPVSQKNAWSVLADDTGSARNSPPQKPLDSAALPHAATSYSPAFSKGLFGNVAPASSDPFAGHPGMADPFAPKVFPGAVPQHAGNAPGFSFTPPQWVYEDPSGRLQGPFNSEQMHGWFKEGYFPHSLPIKCVGDPGFIPLYTFVDRYGSDAPFLVSLAEQEALEREYYLQGQTQRVAFHGPQFGFPNQPQPIGVHLRGASASSGFGAMDQSGAGFGPAFGTSPPSHYGPVFGSAGQPQPTDQAFLNFMSQKQQMDMERQVERAPSPPRKPASPTRQVERELEGLGLEPSQHPAARPPSPKKPAKHQVDEDGSAAAAVAVEKRKKSKSPSRPPPESEDPLSPPASASQTKPAPAAPWAKKPTSADSKPTLAEIQALEAKKAGERDAAKRAQAQAKILAEAQALAQQELAGTESGLGGAQWASAATASKPKKTLAEIMADETKQKKAQQQAPASSGAGKGYAASIGNAAPPRPLAKTASKAAVVAATGPVFKAAAGPVSPAGDGWSTVGAKAKSPVTPPAPAVSTSTKAPAKIQYAGGPGSTAVNASGQAPSKPSKPSVSEGFQSWYRKALLPVSRDSGLNEFISILLSVSVKETATITMICDDALASAIDSRAFANEFIKRRTADLAGVVYSPSVHDDGWTSVSGKGSMAAGGNGAKEKDQGFEVVGKKKKGRK
ncbi:hypothetical protein HDU91_004764 [Kappamyces sp. JEL0680]|nr:hypothetical protein HDU91_004764 [Kappamyces sp. JEL0680]